MLQGLRISQYDQYLDPVGGGVGVLGANFCHLGVRSAL